MVDDRCVIDRQAERVTLTGGRNENFGVITRRRFSGHSFSARGSNVRAAGERGNKEQKCQEAHVMGGEFGTASAWVASLRYGGIVHTTVILTETSRLPKLPVSNWARAAVLLALSPMVLWGRGLLFQGTPSPPLSAPTADHLRREILHRGRTPERNIAVVTLSIGSGLPGPCTAAANATRLKSRPPATHWFQLCSFCGDADGPVC